MLVLSRRLNEKVLIPQFNTAIQVVAIKPGAVRLGIAAPPEVTVLREEVRDRAAEWGAPLPAPAEPAAGAKKLQEINRLLRNRLKVAHRGLHELRTKLEAGLLIDAEETLDRLEEDFRLIWDRLRAEGDTEVPSPAPWPRKTRALLVEDNANERELLATFLRVSGLDVATAGDGADALDYLRTHTAPDMLLLDMGLPRCDGATVVRNLRRDPAYSGLKIFAVSGHVAEEFDLARGPAGVNRWFHKPIDPAELVRGLNQEMEVPATCVGMTR
jgi:carbon storage regulator CsrA